MDVRILGPLRVLRDGTEVETGAPKQRLLLAVLACSRGETVSVDRLVDELWGAAPPPRVASSVQAYVSKLRLVLEPDRPARTPPSVLVTRAPGYALLLEPEQLDASRFAEAAEQTRGLLAAGPLDVALRLRVVAHHGAGSGYTGDWKDTVATEQAENATDADGSSPGYTGDWKDTVARGGAESSLADVHVSGRDGSTPR
jgi:hypothetical protein